MATSSAHSTSASYAAAGVDTAAGDRAVELMKAAVSATHGPGVVGGFGGFAGLFDVSALKDYAKLLGDLADASNDTAQQTKLLGKAGAIVDRLKTSSTSLEKAGYSFGIDDTTSTAKTGYDS